MKKIIVGSNDREQRVDRFLKKYFEKASLSFIYKNLRKKNIKVNGKKAKPEDILKENDEITLYLSDDTIDKFKKDLKKKKSSKFPDVLYEDENVLFIKKPVNMLTHNDKKEYEDNALDRFVDYLIFKGEYNERFENTFRPAICNRLDRNTSGILIGAKNAKTLKDINANIRNRNISKYYITVVKGEVKENFKVEIKLKKDNKNIVRNNEEGKVSVTKFYPVISKSGYTILLVDLITGRTHQIRASLKQKGLNIIGDRKYGDNFLNNKFKKYNLNGQLLHNFLLDFNVEGELSYLNGKEFIFYPKGVFEDIIRDIFGISLGDIDVKSILYSAKWKV